MLEQGSSRNLSVRLPQELFDRLAFLAKIEDQTLGEVMRRAIHEYAQNQLENTEVHARAEALREELDLYLHHPSKV